LGRQITGIFVILSNEMKWIAGKALDISSEFIWHALVRFFRFISPLKVAPKKIEGRRPNEFLPIISLQIKNRTRQSLYNVRVAGISKNKFEIITIGDNLEKGKTVEHMSLNTNVLIADVIEKETNNHGWVLVLHKIEGSSTVDMKIKVNNSEDIYFKVMDYRFKEAPVTERSDGVVGIPFTDKPLPKI
jgi:hypothetical protein